MRMNRLGNSDLVVSAVGAGTWAMGGDFFGAIDDKKCIDSLCASLDHGVNLIDTAPIYGKGHSETLVGQAIKGRRDKVVLCTKVGLLFDDPKGRQGKCLQPDSIEYEIEQSLRRLGTDYIDLYQIHWPDVNTPIEETMEALLRIQKAGKVRYLVYQVKIIIRCRLVSAQCTAAGAAMRYDIALFRVRLGKHRFKRCAALGRAIARIFVNMERPEAVWAMISRGVAERRDLSAAMLTVKSAVVL